MRKFYSILMAFMMIFVMLQIPAFAEETVEVTEEVIEYPEAMGKIQLLYQLGIFDTEYDVADSVTRADFAMILTRLLKAENMLDSLKGVSYTDVTSDGYASEQINLMHVMNIMTGKTETEFYPDDDITDDEALNALVRLLGYDLKAYAKGGWTTGFNMTAKDLGITKGVPEELCVDYAGAGALAVMIFNAMDVPMVGNYSSKDGSYVILSGNDKTLMKDYWNIVKEEGIVNGVGNTNLFGVNEMLTVDEIEINMVKYLINNYEYKDYLGMNVEYYYVEDEMTVTQTVLFMETLGNVKKVRLTTNNPASIDGNTITYTERNTKKKTTYKVASDAIILANGYSVNTIEGNYPENGYIDLISNGGNSYDVAIMYDFDTYVVRSAAEDRIALYYDQIYAVSGKPYIEITDDTLISIIKNDEYVEISQIIPGEVISVAYHPEAGYLIYVSDKTAEFEVESTLSTPFRVTSGEEEYIVNEDFLDLIEDEVSGTSEIDPGKNYTFKFDFLGNIYGMGEFKSDMMYGFIDGIMSSGVFANDVKLKMFSQMGHTEYTLTEKVEFNGVLTDRDKVFEDVKAWLATTGPGNLPMSKFKLLSKTEISALTIATVDGRHPELISDDIIVRTRCAVPGTGGTYSVYQDSEQYVTGYLWPDCGALYPDASLKAMYLPLTVVGKDANNKDVYGYGKEENWKVDGYQRVFPKTNNKIDPITFYDCDEFQSIGYAVRMEVSAGSDINVRSQGTFLVESVSVAVDDKEDQVYKLNCWKDGERYSYITASNDDVINVVKTLKEGDVVMFNTGLSSEITGIMKVFSYDVKNFDANAIKTGGAVHNVFVKMNASDIYLELTKFDKFKKTGSDMYLKVNPDKLTASFPAIKLMGTSVTIYDGNSFSKGDLSTLTSGDVILYKHHYKVHDIIVFRNFPENYEFEVSGNASTQVFFDYE